MGDRLPTSSTVIDLLEILTSAQTLRDKGRVRQHSATVNQGLLMDNNLMKWVKDANLQTLDV